MQRLLLTLLVLTATTPLLADTQAGLNTAVRVRVAAAEYASIGDHATASGVVTPFRRAVVAAEAAGRVVERLVQPGDTVRSGQILLQLDDERARIALREAQARKRTRDVNLAEARSELARGENLRQKQFISEDTLETLRFAVQRAISGASEADAALASARRMLADTQIRAPFDGSAELVQVDVGDFVNPGSPVATLVDFSRARVRAGVTAREAAQISIGSAARIGLEALGAGLLTGQVKSVSRISDPGSGTYTVEIWIDNPDDKLREGMLASVRLGFDSPDTSLTVPSVGVFRRDGKMHVFTVRDNVAELRTVETGRTSGATTEIVRGLEAGERVVVDGQFALRDSAPVTVLGE